MDISGSLNGPSNRTSFWAQYTPKGKDGAGFPLALELKPVCLASLLKAPRTLSSCQWQRQPLSADLSRTKVQSEQTGTREQICYPCCHLKIIQRAFSR